MFKFAGLKPIDNGNISLFVYEFQISFREPIEVFFKSLPVNDQRKELTNMLIERLIQDVNEYLDECDLQS